MKSTGTQTFQFYDICFDATEQIGIHNHPMWELSYVINGIGERLIGNSHKRIQQGEVVLIPPGIRHCWNFDSSQPDPIANISVLFSTSTLEGIKSTIPEMAETINVILQLSDAIEYREPVQSKIKEVLHAMQEMNHLQRIPHVIELLLFLSDTQRSKVAGRNDIITPIEKRLERINVYCRCNFNKQIKLTDVALHAGMNKSSFCIFIKKHTGLTFTQYLNEIRLQKSVEMLKNKSIPIVEVAYGSGFMSVPYFNRVFKNKFGVSPSIYKMRLL